MANFNLSRLNCSYFFYSLLILCLSYLVFECLYIPYWALSADEFVFARHIYEYTYHLPYLDFPPYKTILGYYLFSLPFFFSHDLLAPLFYIKIEIAVINIIFIALISKWSTNYFDKKSILFTWLILIANQLFLIYSTDLRVDMLTSWVCLLSIISAIAYRPRLAGFCLALAFLISQKTLWYFFAINGALVFCWLLLQSKKYTFRFILTFNAFVIMIILAYAIGWSLISNTATVWYNLFYEAYIQAGIDWYMPIYLVCWQTVLRHSPLLFLFWPAAFIGLFDKTLSNEIKERQVFMLTVASLALFQFILYKQAFPYNFVFTIPAFFILCNQFFANIENIHATWRKVIILLVSFFGVIYPGYTSLKIANLLDGRYQQQNLKIANQILMKEDSYVGGIPFLYQKDQAIDGMKNLIGPAIEYLYFPSDKLKKLLLPSLYLSASTQAKIIADFEQMPVKLIINNYRINILTGRLGNYINQHYQHYNGSLYLYAPLVQPSDVAIKIKFSGPYRIETSVKSSVIINEQTYRNGQVIYLKKGQYSTHTPFAYRLALQADIKTPEPDQWVKMIKAILL